MKTDPDFYVEVCNREIPVYLKSTRAMKEDWAHFDGNTESISIRRDMTVEMRRRTLAHECFHAMLFFTGHNEILKDISDNYEESLVRAFETALGDHLRFPADAEAWVEGVE